MQVALTAILWGCGTAVGEVPPYFLSYKAASAGRRDEAFHDIQQAVQEGTSGIYPRMFGDGCLVLTMHDSCIGQPACCDTEAARCRSAALCSAALPASRAVTAGRHSSRKWLPVTSEVLRLETVLHGDENHLSVRIFCCCCCCCAGKRVGLVGQVVAAMQAWMMRVIQQHGFYGILLLASWPNAAFDLCGICCGAFLMPFWEFFGATLIGKGVIKVSGQSLFFVALFR